MLTDKQITQFQQIYRKRFSKEISIEEAQEKGIKLVNLMRVVYSPLAEEDFNLLKKENLTKPNN
jgi:hypothetical protein